MGLQGLEDMLPAAAAAMPGGCCTALLPARSRVLPPRLLSLPQPSALMRRHRLKLVSTSKVCELRLREPTPNPADSLLLGDGTAAVPAIVAEEAVSVADGDSGLLLPAAITQPLRPADLAVVAGASASLSPVDRVTASLAAAMEAASAAAQGVYSAAVPYAGGCGRAW